MAMSLQEQLRAQRAKTERWIREREAQVRQMATQAEAKGRQIYAQAIKTGHKVVAGTPSELRQLGLAAVQGRLPAAVGLKVAKKAAPPKPTVVVRPPAHSAKTAPDRSVQRQLEAGVSGFVDEASFGMADGVLAAGDAIREAIRQGEFDALRRSYDANMAAKRAQDAYDAEHHGFARNTGRVAGFATSVAALGAPGLTRAAFAAIPRGRVAQQVAELGLRYGPDPHGLAKMASAGGAAAGMVDQVVGDTLSERRTTLPDLVAAGAGGALGGITTRFIGPGLGGAVGGAGTSAISDLVNGRDVSLEKAARGAQAGAALGAIGGEVGVDRIRNATPAIKGKAGDVLSKTKAVIRGEKVVGSQRRVHMDPAEGGGWTVADYLSHDPVTNRMRVGEAKMGPWSSLSPRQIQALQKFGDDYVVDFWSFSDVGKATGTATSPFGTTFAANPEEDRR